MAIRLKKLARCAATKTILWVLFISFSFATLLATVSVVETAQQNYLPAESLQEMEYVNSYDFMRTRRDIVAALYWKHDISKLYNIEHTPKVYYRAEHPDGVTTNAEGKGAEFFKNHRVYGIYETQPNGQWQEIAVSNDHRYMPPYPISADHKQVFSNYQYGYSREYVDDYYETTIYEIPNDSVELSQEDSQPESSDNIPESLIPKVTVYYAFDDASLAGFEAFWQQCRYFYLQQLGLILGLAAAAALSALWLLIVCGRSSSDNELHLTIIDRPWTEIGLGLFLFSVILFFTLFFTGMESIIFASIYKDQVMVVLFCAGMTALAVVVLVLGLSMARLLKAKRFLKNSLTWKLFYWCSLPFKKAFVLLRSCFDERSFKAYPLTEALQKRQIVFLATLGGIMLFCLFMALISGDIVAFWGLLLSSAAIAAISYWHITGNLKTYKEINAGFNESFEEQMKSERTKTALITNVSHDLKTPLTSIITYLDLLEKEELSDSARDYVTVLTGKSQRLKSIVSDLFDLSKSASGNIPMDMEVLDLRRLIEQTMADMRDNIEDSGLPVKTALPEGEVNIYADGKKLYRVFQNVIGNALKYSMPGTRVFITLENENGMATATIKNTAGYEMDFTADEVLQRFARGDKSRTGDGSGLGLSIAESFTGACGGSFKVELDGDLFKVIISFAATA